MSTQISAHISDETKAQLEAFVTSRGVTRARLIEDALQHHLQALREIPDDLVVEERYQGKGIGSALPRFALRLAIELRDRLGCTGAVVDAKPDAVDFYRRLGFVELPTLIGALGDRPEPVPMFLPIRQIAKASNK